MTFRRLTTTLLAALTAMVGIPASATCQTASCGCAEIGVDAIYWRPFGSGMQLGVLSNTVTTEVTDQTTNECTSTRPDYSWGVRAYGRYFIPCSNLFLGAEYSWFQPKGSIEVGPLTSTQTFVGVFGLGNGQSFKGSTEMTHHAADVVIGYSLCCNSCASVSVAGGAQYVDLEDRLSGEANLTTQTQEVTQRARFRGVGPLARLDVQGTILNCLNVRIASLVGGLVGDRNFNRDLASATGEIVDTTVHSHDSNTTFVPVVGTELGLGYQFNLCNICWGIEGGYRQRSYFHVLNADFCDGNQTMTVAGPYVGINATF